VDKRTFSFDLINSNIIDRLIIYKSGSAENPGDFAGGIIKLFTIDQVDQNYTSLQLGTAYRSGTTMNDYFQSQGSKTDILGFDNSFRTLPGDFPKTNTLIRSNRNDELRTKAAHSLSNNWVAASSMAMPDISMGFRMGRNYNFANGSQLSMINMISVSQEYQTYTREFNRYWEWVDRSEPIMNRFGYVDNLYQKENKVSILSNWNFKLNRNTRIKFKNFFNQIGENETIIRNGYDVIRQGDDLRNYLLGYRQRSIYTGQMEGVHTLNPSNEIQWVAGTSYLGESEPDLRRFRTFRPQTAPEGTNFSMQLPPNSNLFETGRYFGDLNEWSFNHGLNYQHKKKLDSQKEFVVKAGYYGDYRTRSFNSRYFSYLYPGVFNPSIGEELRSLPLNEIFSNENIRTKDGFVLEEGTKASDSYSGTNLVTAGYINAEIPLNRFFISAGVRTEYNVITLDSRNDVEKINVNKQLLSLLPSFNISYSLTSKHQLRGSYSRTVNRPEFREIAPFLFYDYKLEAGRIGNPDLVSAKIDNIDFRYEYYPRSGEIISVGAFYKYFDNPIENTTINTNEVPSFSYGNADWAQNYGVEIEFRKSLKGMTNSSFIDALSFNINASLIRSKVDLGDRPLAEQRVRALQGQSPYVLNAALFYAPASGVNVNVIYNIFGNRIYALGSDNFPTIYELPRNFLDISVSKTFGKFTYKLGVNDVLNARYRFFQDSDRNEKIDDSDDAIISYRTGTRYSFSVSYNF
jgi:outer membrane receptor protein involved in Fe transport